MTRPECTYCRGPHRGVDCDRPPGIKPCQDCYDLPWRRDVVGGCGTCGKPFAAEQPGPAETRQHSAISQFGSW